MPTLFHFIRHGSYALLDQALGGREDHPLSDEGSAEAERLALALKERSIAAVVSSPVQRALQTAEPIADRLGLPVSLDPAFSEVDFAAWSGRRFADLHGDPDWRAWNTFRGTAAIPGGETMLSVQARAIEGMMRLAGMYSDAEVAVVSHADVIKAVLSHFLGAPLDLMGRTEIGPGSISRVVLYREDVKVLAVNLPP